jgi:hypothetical protein
VFTPVVLALTLVGFGATSLVGTEPVWAAIGGVAVLVARALTQRRVFLEQMLHDNLDISTPGTASVLRLVAPGYARLEIRVVGSAAR